MKWLRSRLRAAVINFESEKSGKSVSPERKTKKRRRGAMFRVSGTRQSRSVAVSVLMIFKTRIHHCLFYFTSFRCCHVGLARLLCAGEMQGSCWPETRCILPIRPTQGETRSIASLRHVFFFTFRTFRTFRLSDFYHRLHHANYFAQRAGDACFSYRKLTPFADKPSSTARKFTI